MTAKELTSKQEFEQSILSGVSLVDFDAHWCQPCRDQVPVLDIIENAFAGRVTVARLTIDAHHHLAMNLGIQSIPTLIVFRDGRELCRFIGFQDAQTLDQALQKALIGTPARRISHGTLLEPSGP